MTKLRELVASLQVALETLPPGHEIQLPLGREELELILHLLGMGVYLEWHERDIAHGINDFGELRDTFKAVFGREPNK